MSDTKDIAKKIKSCRIAHEMTLKELGAKVGITEATMQKYEAGKIKSISAEMIEKIAFALGVNPAWLVGWNENRTSVIIASIKEDV